MVLGDTRIIPFVVLDTEATISCTDISELEMILHNHTMSGSRSVNRYPRSRRTCDSLCTVAVCLGLVTNDSSYTLLFWHSQSFWVTLVHSPIMVLSTLVVHASDMVLSELLVYACIVVLSIEVVYSNHLVLLMHCGSLQSDGTLNALGSRFDHGTLIVSGSLSQYGTSQSSWLPR
jgi:hypothetical protein